MCSRNLAGRRAIQRSRTRPNVLAGSRALGRFHLVDVARATIGRKPWIVAAPTNSSHGAHHDGSHHVHRGGGGRRHEGAEERDARLRQGRRS